MSRSLTEALSSAILRLLRPLVRILLRNGVSHRTFSELAKWVYVDVATREFSLDERKQSVSRVSVLTGLTRKEVARLQALPGPTDNDKTKHYNRAARVISGWLRDRRFRDGRNRPAALPIEGGKASFTALVRKHSGDVPVRAILDELVRVGAVDYTRDGRVRLMTNAYVPQAGEAERLNILGTDVGHLIHTIDHNLQADAGQLRFQRKVAYDNLPDAALPAFRKLSGRQAQALLEKLNAWLAEHDRDANPGIKGEGRNRAGVGIFYFEEPYDKETDDTK